MIILATIIIAFLGATFQALRIPHLDIPLHGSSSEKLQALDDWFNLIHKKEKFNGVVLISKKGKIIFSNAYGLNGAEIPKPLTTHSSFNLASVSKQFTAMGVVLLNEQSKLNYEDKISAYIPELSYYKDISIRHLLNHTSGLPDYMKLAVQHGNDTDVFTNAKLISLYNKHQPKLNFAPGTKFQYSNTGYVLLAEIIERASGSPFQEFMQENIFDPLNMNDTQTFNLLSEHQPNKRVYGFAPKYWLFGGKKKLKDLNYFDGVAGDGAVYASAHDLNIWHEALRDGALVSNESYKVAYTPARLTNNSQTKYGFGWFLNDDNSVEHAGGWQGFTSYIYRDMENDNLIVILDNSSNTLRVNSIGFRFNSIGLNLKEIVGAL